jgi:hypothetical protein
MPACGFDAICRLARHCRACCLNIATGKPFHLFWLERWRSCCWPQDSALQINDVSLQRCTLSWPACKSAANRKFANVKRPVVWLIAQARPLGDMLFRKKNHDEI